MPIPLILVTNDDGIMAKGLLALVSVMKTLGEVVVVAPDKGQSGMGHAITINSTLRLKKTNFHNVREEYSCSGTPVDCVKIAVNKILPRKPDLCVSGINHGKNNSINVIYSGTMSAAVEGAIENIPSIGFSLDNTSPDANFESSMVMVKKITEQLIINKLPNGACLNVNIPDVEFEKIKGIKICRQGKANWIEELDERLDPNGQPYYWLSGRFENFESDNQETDTWGLENEYVTIVPVQYDMTAYSVLPDLKKWKFQLKD